MAVYNLTGAVTDEGLCPENIRKGVTILGVMGTLSPIAVLTEAEYRQLEQYDTDTLYVITA